MNPNSKSTVAKTPKDLYKTKYTRTTTSTYTDPNKQRHTVQDKVVETYETSYPVYSPFGTGEFNPALPSSSGKHGLVPNKFSSSIQNSSHNPGRTFKSSSYGSNPNDGYESGDSQNSNDNSYHSDNSYGSDNASNESVHSSYDSDNDSNGPVHNSYDSDNDSNGPVHNSGNESDHNSYESDHNSYESDHNSYRSDHNSYESGGDYSD